MFESTMEGFDNAPPLSDDRHGKEQWEASMQSIFWLWALAMPLELHEQPQIRLNPSSEGNK